LNIKSRKDKNMSQKSIRLWLCNVLAVTVIAVLGFVSCNNNAVSDVTDGQAQSFLDRFGVDGGGGGGGDGLYTLTTNVSPAGTGAVTREPNQASYTAGAGVVVTLTATADGSRGDFFTHWTGTGISEDTANPIQITMNNHRNITAHFVSRAGSFTDSRDGQVYRTITIGGQTWMAENLNFGGPSSAPNSIGMCGSSDETLVSSGGLCDTYGRLYDWATVMGLPSSCNSSSCADQIQSRHRGICPTGWHVPSDDEWERLIDFVGGWDVAGTKLRSTTGWFDGSGYVPGTDDFGFSALPGGYGWSDYFGNAGYFGYWWIATEDGAGLEWDRYRFHFYSYAYRFNSDLTYLFSVRCLRDD
jgi:uncharacterized protein (TIGR02145 family)